MMLQMIVACDLIQTIRLVPQPVVVWCVGHVLGAILAMLSRKASKLFIFAAILFITQAAYADPPCHIPARPIVAPQRLYPHAIHAATVFHDTHLHLVEVPVPAFVFQTLTAYTPPPIIQQVVQPAAPPATPAGVGTDEMLAALMAGPSEPDPLAEIRQKCASCHSVEKGTSKGGLALFDQAGQFAPTTKSGKTLTRGDLVTRARSTGADVMPPAAATDPSKRLSEAALAYLEQGQGQSP